jgi:flavin-dependent dehydrogenase
MEKKIDVLVVGGGPVGIYFGGLMAKQGYQVLICENTPEDQAVKRYTVIHMGKQSFAENGLPDPKKGDPDYITEFDQSILKSSKDKYPKHTTFPILVLRRKFLIQRLARWAVRQGAELSYDTNFEKPLFDDKGRIAGGVLYHNSKELTVYSRLVADASGMAAVVRTRLPAYYGVETFALGPDKQHTVILHYAKLDGLESGPLNSVTTWLPDFVWIAPSDEEGGAVIGIGGKSSFECEENRFKEFCKRGLLPAHKINFIEVCSNPGYRALLSFVSDGFVALGDAACLLNPSTGEGIPYSWKLCKIAANEFGMAMKNGAYPERGQIWQVNTRYAQLQGAEFAMGYAIKRIVFSVKPEEFDILFEHSILFEDEKERGKKDIGSKIREAVQNSGLSAETAEKLRKAFDLGKKIYTHYRAYPDKPSAFDAWAGKAAELWKQAH